MNLEYLYSLNFLRKSVGEITSILIFPVRYSLPLLLRFFCLKLSFYFADNKSGEKYEFF